MLNNRVTLHYGLKSSTRTRTALQERLVLEMSICPEIHRTARVVEMGGRGIKPLPDDDNDNS